MFRRRIPRNFSQRLRELLWPSMGLRRLGLYYRHRIRRLPGTPRSIAAGLAAGVAISFTPFIGFHLALGGLIAWTLRGSLIAMVIGTVIAGNPWTFPFIWIATYRLGRVMLGRLKPPVNGVPDGLDLSTLMNKPVELLLPMTLGALPFAVFFGLMSFYICRHLVSEYRKPL